MKPGVGGQSGFASNIITTESPIRTSALPDHAGPLGRRDTRVPSAVEGPLQIVDELDGVAEMIHGVTVV